MEKMNTVISEFLRELEGKISHKFKPFFFDPSTSEFVWDQETNQLLKNPEEYS
jgi:hypothetical protein